MQPAWFEVKSQKTGYFSDSFCVEIKMRNTFLNKYCFGTKIIPNNSCESLECVQSFSQILLRRFSVLPGWARKYFSLLSFAKLIICLNKRTALLSRNFRVNKMFKLRIYHFKKVRNVNKVHLQAFTQMIRQLFCYHIEAYLELLFD